MTSDHENKEEMLREQLRQARRELEDERRANIAADAALRAQEAQESRKRNDEILGQLRDLAGTLKEQREIHQECRSVEKKVDDVDRTEKSSGVATLRGMMNELREAQTAHGGHHKERAVKADVDAMLAEARRNNTEHRAAFTSIFNHIELLEDSARHHEHLRSLLLASASARESIADAS